MIVPAALALGALVVAGLASSRDDAPAPADCADHPAAHRPGASPAVRQLSAGTTYHVRTDGGDATQCNGRADAPYPGHGSAQDCAWNSPLVALPGSGAARIAGGDTLVIGSGTYPIDSVMQPVPSGSAAARTRILGRPTGKDVPKLVGTNGIHRVLDLEGSSHVELGHLEISDGSDCVHRHSSPEAACGSGDDWARVGIHASGSRDVWIHDINVHGLAARGFQAGGLADWTLERVRINRNGTAGWDGNVSGNGSNSGRIVMRNIEIGWNGCGERVSTGEAWACWGQEAGGYGDGLGTTSTGGQWLIEDAYIHHNTSDGLDLLYMDGAESSSVTLRRVYAVGNAGNQVKVTGNALVEHSVIVGHCMFFKGRDFMVDGDNCRAYGAALLLNPTGKDAVTVRYNTLAGEGEALVGIGSRNASDRVEIHDNIGVGFPYFVDGSQPPFVAGGRPERIRMAGNLGWNLHDCAAAGVACGRPGQVDARPDAFDPIRFAGAMRAGHAAAAPCADSRMATPQSQRAGSPWPVHDALQ